MASEKVTALVEEVKGLTVLGCPSWFTLWRKCSVFPPLLLLWLAPLWLPLPWKRRRPSLTLS